MQAIEAIIKLIFSMILSLSTILAPVDGLITSGGESAYFTQWSEEDKFDIDDYAVVEKEAGEDFVVLNITDVQLNDDEVYGAGGEYSNALITKMVEEYQPDLITLSGDNSWCTMGYLELINLMESFDIPWAPIMGNHDGQGCISEFWAAERLANAENCLFEFGPEGMGYGNYIVNVKEGDKLVHTFYMMDSHADAEFELEDGTTVEGYDHFWYNQLEWYEWAVKGITEEAGYVVPSTAVFHIPVYEIHEAWEMVSIPSEDNEFGVVAPEYADVVQGGIGELPCPAPVNNGFFDLCKELGSTKTMVFGHDHYNDAVIPFEGITLAYGVKSGFGSYWDFEMIGGTTLTINSVGDVDVQQHYYDLEENGFHIYND